MSEVRLNVNLPADLLAEFRKVAEANDRSVSGHVRWLMKEAVREAQEKST